MEAVLNGTDYIELLIHKCWPVMIKCYNVAFACLVVVLLKVSDLKIVNRGNMNTIRSIIETELEYIKCFSNFCDEGNLIRFNDDFILDMYSHNLTYLKRPILGKEFSYVVEEEIRKAKEKRRNFQNIQFDFDIEKVNAFINKQDCTVTK